MDLNLNDPEATYKSLDLPVPATLNKPPYGGKPKFVKFAPGDSGDFLPHVFYEGAYCNVKLLFMLKLLTCRPSHVQADRGTTRRSSCVGTVPGLWHLLS